MLFLLNDQILDLGVPEMTLRELAPERAVNMGALSASAVIELGQEVYFNLPEGKAPDEKARMVLACLIAITIEAEAAVFVKPPRAVRPKQVAVRLATLPITTLSFLEAMQEVGDLTPRLINQTVWEQAA